MPVRYLVFPKPDSHRFYVTLEVASPDPSGQILSLPAWIPGSYMIRDFAKHIVSLRATKAGIEVPLTKVDKQTWRLPPTTELPPGPEPILLEYPVFAWDLSVRKAHLDFTHGYFNGTSLFLRVHGQEDARHEVAIQRPTDPRCAEWRVATTLPADQAEPLQFGTYFAHDYDELIDHPVEMGTFTYATFEALGIPHAVAITGVHHTDMDTLCGHFKAICEEHLRTMGVPDDLERYLFQIMVVDSGYGGLEHRTSTSLICSRTDLPTAGAKDISKGYRVLLSLTSHEYFHLWNVKRIKPDRFTPYTLERESHTPQLWSFEGITSYYEPLGLVRAGIIPTDSFLELLTRKFTEVMRRRGRFVQTVTESSFNAWTGLYQQDADTPNATVNYYTTGCMIALTLDLHLRDLTDGRVDLDVLMRELFDRYGRTKLGVPDDGIQRLAEELTGADLSTWFDEALHGLGNGTWDQLVRRLADVGIDAILRARTSLVDQGGLAKDEAPQPHGYIGVLPRKGSATIQFVFTGSPAERAGLSPGDTVIAIDNLKVGRDLFATIDGLTPGSAITVHAFRRDELHTFAMTVEDAPRDTVTMRVTADIDPDVEAKRNRWIGARTPPEA